MRAAGEEHTAKQCGLCLQDQRPHEFRVSFLQFRLFRCETFCLKVQSFVVPQTTGSQASTWNLHAGQDRVEDLDAWQYRMEDLHAWQEQDVDLDAWQDQAEDLAVRQD